MEKETTEFRQATVNDIPGICELHQSIGWGTTPYLMKFFFKKHPEGVRVATYKGTIVDDDQAFICTLAVDKSHRRKGIAKQLLKNVINTLGSRNICLFATPDGLPLYEKLGFQTGPEPFYISQITESPFSLDKACNVNKDEEVTVSEYTSIEKLVDYDTTIHRIPRADWLEDRLHISKCYVATNLDGQLCGYAFLFESSRSTKDAPIYVLQPLLADNKMIANQILIKVIENIPANAKIQSLIPLQNEEAISLFSNFGMSPSEGKTALFMFTKKYFEVDKNKIFSMTNDMNSFA